MSGVPSLPIRRRDDDLDTVLGAIDTAGAVIIEDFLSDRQLADLRAELAPHAAEADPDMEHVNDVMQTFYRRVRNVTGLAGKSEVRTARPPVGRAST